MPDNIHQSTPKITILKNGPYRVTGNIPLAEEIIVSGLIGMAIRWKPGVIFPPAGTYLLCRCGKSANMPFCDNAHRREVFDGTETAIRKRFREQAERIEGPDLVLDDAKALCAAARFCFRRGGIWNMTRESDDPAKRELAVEMAGQCPAGRLVVRDKSSDEPIEPSFSKSISIVMDDHSKCPGPLWVKGGIPIQSSNGKYYEIRNRVTLCRCGKSKNNPFCDGAHVR